MEYDGDNKRVQHWHLEKSISIGHIVTTIAIAGSVMAWAMSMDTRVSIVETQIKYSANENQKSEANFREGVGEIKSALIRIEAKLDNKADKK